MKTRRQKLALALGALATAGALFLVRFIDL
jgi:hypothetical protein